MNLLPWPREISFGAGSFRIGRRTEIVLGGGCDSSDIESLALLQEDIHRIACFIPSFSNAKKPGQTNCICLMKGDIAPYSYFLDIGSGGIDIVGKGSEGLFYAIQTLRQAISSEGAALPEMHVRDYPDFECRGFMHDVTRGKVPKLETLMELADRASYYKLNQLQLYIEHTFAFQNMTEVWRGADPITAEEILALDEHCRRRHIELVPAVATFGHLYEALRTKSYRHLCELGEDDAPFTWPDRQLHHTLDVSNPESIALVREMLNELMPLFSSDKVNICCDETFDLGCGKNRGLAGKVGKGRLYMDFLLKIIGHVQASGKTALFWDDILLEHPEYLKELPRDVVCLTWQYAAEVQEEKFQRIAGTGLRQYVCPGVSAWNRLAADMDAATANILGSAAYGRKHAAIGLLNTDWGDYGHINLLSASLPGMILGACAAWNGAGVPEPKQMDGMISALEYGDGSGKIVPLQRELGGLCCMGWSQLVAWHCEKFLGRRFEYPNTDGLAAVPEDRILACRSRAKEIGAEFAGLSRSVPESRRQDLEELAAAAAGTALLNGLLLAFKKYEFGQEIGAPVDPAGLASGIELWLADYAGLWRNRNKQSELGKIQAFLFSVCDWLRSLQ